MKKLLIPAVLIATALSSLVLAQSAGKVTLSTPATPGTATPTPAPVPTSKPASSSSKDLSDDVPAGWNEIRGRISAGRNVKLPAGSSVNVSLDDLTSRKRVVNITFKTPSLSAPYQLFLNPGRLNKTHQYGVSASVIDTSGRVLYTTATAAPYAQDARAVIDLTLNLAQ